MSYYLHQLSLLSADDPETKWFMAISFHFQVIASISKFSRDWIPPQSLVNFIRITEQVIPGLMQTADGELLVCLPLKESAYRNNN